MNGRWSDYVLATEGGRRSPSDLWVAGRSEKDLTLWIMGVGFDPRCLVGLQQMIGYGLGDRLEIGVVELPRPSSSSDPNTRTLAADNASLFEEIVERIPVRKIAYPDVHEAINAGPRIARQVSDPAFLDGVGQIIVDISSLPSTIYFPLIASLIRATDLASNHEASYSGELQVVACENPVIDAAITEHGVEAAAVVGGFRGALDRDVQAAGQGTVIWAPTIGEHCAPSLRAVHDFLDPDDTTPVLPFPARQPRRADDLILEHQLELFERFQIEAANIIYADERNPYDLYRTLLRVHRDYEHALAPLRPTTLALSAHSSKLLSLGVLLAAYEVGLPIVSAPARDYSLDGTLSLDDVSRQNQVVCTWLAGAPFSRGVGV